LPDCHRQALQSRPEVLAVARELIEFIEAHLRAEGRYLVLAICRAVPESIAQRMLRKLC